MLADCIRLAQTNNEALEALLQKFAPLIKKCGRQLHIEDGNEEMILAFIELVKDFSPSNLRNIDDGTVVQYIKQSMYHYCFRIYKKYHHVETVIGWDEISPKEEAEYLATQDKIQLNDGLLTELQIDVLTKREREREIITLMFENSLTAAEIARRWGCSRQSVNQGKIVALKKLRKTFSTPISTKTLHNIERAKR